MKIGTLQVGDDTLHYDVTNENSRLLKARHKYEMLRDNYFELAKTEIGNILVNANETGILKNINTNTNLMKLICEEWSKVYKKAPTRIFDEAVQDDMTALYKQYDIDSIMQQANFYVKGLNDILIQVGYKDGFTFKLRRPDNTVIKIDKDGNTIVFIFIGKDDGKQLWRRYTAQDIADVYVSSALDIQKDDYELKNIEPNTLKRLPFVFINSSFRDEEFWDSYTGDNMYTATMQISFFLTHLNHLVKLQSWKQLVASGSNLSINQSDVKVDPATIMWTGENELSVLDLESNYKMLWDVTKEVIESTLITHKISASSFKTTGNVTSGFGLMMENLRLDEAVEEQFKVYEKAENDLFGLIKDINEALKLGIKTGDDFKIQFEISSYPKEYK